jgi:hypothetical protein
VYQGRPATLLECAVSRSAADFYLDMDDSFAVSAGDTLVGGAVACNGANGIAGINGTELTERLFLPQLLRLLGARSGERCCKRSLI